MEERMNMVYDIVLNFSKVGSFIDFYEWNEDDNIIIINKIPIFRISRKQLIDMFKSYIQLDKAFLKKIYHKTHSDEGLIDYTCLFTDMSRVLALKFNISGDVIEQSTLLLDEENAVIEENYDLDEIKINYKINKKFNITSFLTRKDREIQYYLISEIERLYDVKDYDEIEYLYYEIFSDTKEIDKMYNILIENIRDNFNEKYYQIYKIIKMISTTNFV